ncbi:MAG: hypothetical protein IIA65_03840 [Planctomycetes bacterium]|nr:hypothetical protein [Planctomycetota bacterium]
MALSPLNLYNTGMSNSRKVILLLETSREYARQLQFGITKYSYFNGPWTFYREPGGRDRPLPQLREWGANGSIAHVKDAARARKIEDAGIDPIARNLRRIKHMSPRAYRKRYGQN